MGPVFEKGLYEGECIDQFMGQSQNEKKTPYVALKFRIKARITEDNTLANCPEGERCIYLYLSDGAMPIAVEVLRHLGYEKDSLRFLDPNNDGHHSFVGRTCDLWCGHEEYKGNMKEKWSVSTPREKKEVVPIEQSEMRRLDALFGKAIKEHVPTTPKAQTKAESPKADKHKPNPAATAPPPGDDIPF